MIAIDLQQATNTMTKHTFKDHLANIYYEMEGISNADAEWPPQQSKFYYDDPTFCFLSGEYYSPCDSAIKM